MDFNLTYSKDGMKAIFSILIGLFLFAEAFSSPEIIPFGKNGKFKMLYDARQRPQSVLIKSNLYVVYNGDVSPTSDEKGKAYPMLVSYDPAKRVFSEPVRLSEKSESDHHYSPIIWADENDHLHVLFGCHRTSGTYLVSKQPVGEQAHAINWKKMPPIAPKLSYPTVYRIHGDKEVIYYRTDGHTSSWTYKISADNGKTWNGPERDVTDLDAKGRLDWSSYQVKIPSRDGKRLHVVFTDYDDNKISPSPQRFYNPRYDRLVNNEWKYNLSYLSIDLRSHAVYNANGASVTTPVDLDSAKAHCRIWDTEWRGAGIPPVICLDRKGEPSFLHVLSGKSIRSHDYYFVHRRKGRWKQTLIRSSNHQWNSGHLALDAKGILHAYLIVGDGYLEGGYMDKHGGGRIEEWISADKGSSWKKLRDLNPNQKPYEGWRFNNVQPVVRPDGSIVEEMLLFYGWKDKGLPEASAFLLHE